MPLKGTSATFVAPVKTYSKSDLNNWSAVVRLVSRKKSFLFTGDAEFKSETDMINSKQNLQANVLKVGHHGAKTSTSSAFVKKVKPQYAVISVGKNHYGRPTKEVVNLLKPAKILRTDQKGSIVFTTNGSTLSVKTIEKIPKTIVFGIFPEKGCRIKNVSNP
nr:MBL fold metallo-hydrolase [Fictibacillus sp. FJAT-27399]